MQLRCTYCQTMFAIGREETLAALEHMDENHLIYYDAHCPKCRRANRVERLKLEFSYPGWRADLQAMANRQAPAQPAPASPVETAPAAVSAAASPASLPLVPEGKKAHTHTHGHSAERTEKATVQPAGPEAPRKTAAPAVRKPSRKAPPAPARKKPAARPKAPAPKSRKAARPAPARGKKPAAKKKR